MGVTIAGAELLLGCAGCEVDMQVVFLVPLLFSSTTTHYCVITC
jgi:hypothetical protein